ncbi:Protein phosphatase 1 regulatory subunit 42 [Eumeta japonica]|uniref:Protein phosphatase 1 regulatory subunit 42 n=1 Tax=Eumeta variegata TaxID=151549 RepID=A0A4C1V6G0_EUMVA|nr:Protein phosphatase 1 regulatory subunit 42 [Eumeta japonica]
MEDSLNLTENDQDNENKIKKRLKGALTIRSKKTTHIFLHDKNLLDIASLRILNVSENKIADLFWIRPFRRLEVLIARKNNIEDYEEAANVLCTLISLVEINFNGNPMAKKHRYKETIVARCGQLRVLDDVIIHNNSKIFYEGFDKAIRLRQLHEKNKLKLDEQGMEEFFELHMLPDTRPISATVVPRASERPKVKAVDSLYTFTPRMLLGEPRGSRPVEKLPEAAQTKLSMISTQPVSTPSIKGILKKPMPMKYI